MGNAKRYLLGGQVSGIRRTFFVENHPPTGGGDVVMSPYIYGSENILAQMNDVFKPFYS